MAKASILAPSPDPATVGSATPAAADGVRTFAYRLKQTQSRARTADSDNEAADARLQPDCVPACRDLRPPRKGTRHTVSLRMDGARHLALRIAAAKLRRRPEDLLAEAVEEYLHFLAAEPLGQCTCLNELMGGSQDTPDS